MNVRHTKLRIDTIKQRTDSTVLPSIDAVYKKSGGVDLDLTRKFVDQVTYSDYEGIHEDGPVIIDTFLMNKRNIDKFKSSGSLGAIIEGFRRANIQKDFKNEVVSSLISSLNVITNEDPACQARLLSNPHSVPIVKELCFYCVDHNQQISFTILDRLTRIPDGMKTLMEHGIFDVLFTPETLFRQVTLQEVRHMCCQMINRLTHFSPLSFPVTKFMELILDKYGMRRIDGYMEIQLLQALVVHLNRLQGLDHHGHLMPKHLLIDDKHPDKLPFLFTTAKHLITEVQCEIFENLEHLHLIIRVLTILSRCQMQANFMIENSLGMALQFLVKTDFSLYRKSSKNSQKAQGKAGGGNKLKEKMQVIQSDYKRRSIQDCGDRDQGSLMALALITPDGKASRNEDANFAATKSVISIYENIMQGRIETINEVVASGLIPSLLYRVGKGNDRDMRFNKIVVFFLYEILFRVSVGTCSAENHFAFVDLNTKFREYARYNFTSFADYPFANESSGPLSPNSKVGSTGSSVINARGISNTLHAQGVTSLLYDNLFGSDDLVVMSKALFSISYLSFSVIALEAYVRENITRVFTCNSRNDSFFPSLSIICESILYPDVTNDVLIYMLKTMKVVKPLVAALGLNGWKFHLKSTVFMCLGKLSHLPEFRDSVAEAGGMEILAFEVLNRRLTYRTYDFGYRYYKNTIEDECCDRIYMAIRRDISAIKIQALLRRRLGVLRAKRKRRGLK